MKLCKSLQKEQQAFQNDHRFAQLELPRQESLERVVLSSPWFFGWLKQQNDWNEVCGWIETEIAPSSDLSTFSDSWTLDDQDSVMRDLRVWRNRHMARLVARDVLQLNHVRQTALVVSNMADAALSAALKWSQSHLAQRDGEPAECLYSRKPQEIIAIAMGKHGAQELNLSSDIDLIFSFSANGTTTKGRSHEEFFTRVGRKVIQLLDTRTVDGFVFRVDMRLRPWGQSGALVSSFKALQNYYLQHGRFWERYALVKARPVTGTAAAQEQLQKILQPFVYRRYVDFQAVGALRELKAKIQTEVRRQNLDRNIKLGAGGIREVEFIAQVFQLVRGGQDEALQVRGTWPVLRQLIEHELLPQPVVNELIQAYDFLRDLEHRIQAIRDEQTQNLPIDEVDLERLVISKRLPDVDLLLNELRAHRAKVDEHFANIISTEVDESQSSEQSEFIDAWCNGQWQTVEQGELVAELKIFHALPGVQKVSGPARENLDNFMPVLWAELNRFADGAERFLAIRPILESVLRRTSYFSLLSENPQAIREMVKLVPASKWIAGSLQEKPFLLDELTDVNSLYRLPNKAELMDELHQQLLRIPEDDLERQMEALRHFRHGRVLRAAACEVSAHLPLMKISDYLAWVAEVVVEQSLALVWQQMIAKHGRPSRSDGDWCDTDFGVIAYGKMGGLELSYESDLDLVFLHDASPQGSTEGPKSIENVVFMARLGQKLIHMLSSVTPSGMLYEVDTRLRPSGNSGLLVSSLTAFEKYQREQAWTWEHQALVRARFIAGDLSIKQGFDNFRKRIICSPRDTDILKQEVVDMRQKMLDHLGSKQSDNVFHLKHDRGGIVDLEFLVQFLILEKGEQYPELATWSDNVRSIETLQAVGIISEDEKVCWLKGYLTLREEVHHAILAGHGKKVPESEIQPNLGKVREEITAAWQRYFAGVSPNEGDS